MTISNELGSKRAHSMEMLCLVLTLMGSLVMSFARFLSSSFLAGSGLETLPESGSGPEFDKGSVWH